MERPRSAVDTNVLIYSIYSDRPQHHASLALIEQAKSSGANLFVPVQCLAEFFSIITNPKRVIPPQTTQEAIAAVEIFLAMPGLGIILPPPDIVPRWCDLLRRRPIIGADIFDLQIIATMLANGIHRIYTFNQADFEWCPEIEVITPS